MVGLRAFITSDSCVLVNILFRVHLAIHMIIHTVFGISGLCENPTSM